MARLRSGPLGICLFTCNLLIAASRGSAQDPAIGLHYGSDFSTTQYEDFGAWLGRKVMYRVTFLEKSSWAAIKDAALVDISKKWVNSHSGRVEVISMPMFANGDTVSFADIANGVKDAGFRAVAQKIQAAGIADKVIIRLAWEANGDWYRWSYLKNPAGFRSAWRHVVAVMRASAPKLRFEFNISNLANRGATGAKWTEGYPGDDVVDVISMDIYDHWNSWTTMMYGDAGLNEMREFAKAHNKPEAYAEWSCSTTPNGHGDNPGFIRAMASWMDARPGKVLYHAYWNTTGGANGLVYSITSLLVPDASTTYKQLFGATTVSAGNSAPTISAISDRTVDINRSTGAITFTVGDAQTAASNLTITKNVSDPALIPLSHVVLGGSGANRTVTVSPVNNKTGWSTVWLKVSDGQLTKTSSFVVQVSAELSFNDVGSPPIAGSHAYNDSTLTMKGSGNDIYNRADDFHFGSTWLTGDAELTVKVSSLTHTDDWTKAGVMFRGSGASNSAFVAAFVTPTKGVVLQWRTAAGGYASSSPTLAGRAPKWLRLTRSGDSFYAFCSNDGSDWDLIEITDVNLPDTAMGGLAVVAHAANATATAVFDHFSID